MNGRTRFSGLHPYPAMIADELALAIAAKMVGNGTRVLDPFCGTARTLLAAGKANASVVGVDVNPLALLVAEAKAARVDLVQLEHILKRMVPPRVSPAYELEPGRKTEWFSAVAKKELSELITWLNRQELPRQALLPLAAVLSATAREVSFCRNYQWKLHRMAARDREVFVISPWAVFGRRLMRFVDHARTTPALDAEYQFYRGDAKNLYGVLKRRGQKLDFDVVITSPPYGDSRTTVGYGGMSSICLGVLQHVNGLNLPFVPAGHIDRVCLGGGSARGEDTNIDIHKYWRGGQKNAARKRVGRYLSDLREACAELVRVLAANATVVFIVARRSVANRRLYLEEFVQDTMRSLGFDLSACESRLLASKRLPRIVNAAGISSAVRRVATMREEFVLTFQR